jgi:hypothetical protein
MTVERESAKQLRDDISRRATYEYVDRQDANTVSIIHQHIDESRRNEESIKDYMKSIDEKLNILIADK